MGEGLVSGTHTGGCLPRHRQGAGRPSLSHRHHRRPGDRPLSAGPAHQARVRRGCV